jgi:phage terminase large subunit-like protein
VLNRRVEASSPFMSRTLWNTCAAPAKPIEGVPVYGGLDLSAVNDLTALVLIGRVDGVWQVHPTFWLPEHGLAEKARQDRVIYDVWAREKYLLTAPGKSVDYEYVAEYLRGVFDRHDIRKIGFDRWGFVHLRPWLLRAGFTEQQIEEHFVEFGQGDKSMTPALRALEGEVLNGRLAHGGHPVLATCVANSIVIGTDQARKLGKVNPTARIDGAVALADAFGVAPLDEPKAEPEYQVMFLGA